MSRARSVADLGNQNVLDLNATDGTLKVGAGVTIENTGEVQFAGIVTAATVQIGAATTLHSTGLDLGAGNINSHNITSTGNLSVDGNMSVGGVLTYEDVTSVDSVGIITAQAGIRVPSGSLGIGTAIPAGTFQLGDSSGSNVIISENTGIDINDGQLNLYAATTNVNSAPFIISTDVGGIENEKLRFTAGGRLGINTTPGTLLELKGESGKEADVTFNRQPVQGTNDGVIGQLLFENATDSVAQISVKRESAADDAYIQFATQTTGGSFGERLRITSAGLVGIGTDNPGTPLTVKALDNADSISIHGRNADGISNVTLYGSDRATQYGRIQARSTYLHLAASDSTKGVYIDGPGRLLVGTTTAATTYVSLGLQGNGATATNQATLAMAKGALPSGTDQELGRIEFFDNNSNSGGTIVALSDAAWTSGSSHPTKLTFSTTSSGESSPTERMRITAGGALNIGKGDETTNAANLIEMYVGGTDEAYATIRGKYNRTNQHNRSEVRFGVHENSTGSGFLAFATGTNSATERFRIHPDGSMLQKNDLQYKQLGYFTAGTSATNATTNPALAGNLAYGFGYQEAFGTSGGNWGPPYPDLVLGYHTGVRLGGYHTYGGCRFYADHPSSSTTLIMGVNNGNSGVHVTNTLTAGTKTFRIVHPHPSKKYTHDLVHSVIEGPQCDNLYRGRIDLVDGTAAINIDTASNMTDGTFVLLNRDIQCFTSNETGWDAVKGSVSGNILTITSQNNSSTDTISWMVIGERQDDKIKSPDTDVTDSDGKLITEPLTVEQSHM